MFPQIVYSSVGVLVVVSGCAMAIGLGVSWVISAIRYRRDLDKTNRIIAHLAYLDRWLATSVGPETIAIIQDVRDFAETGVSDFSTDESGFRNKVQRLRREAAEKAAQA